MDRATGKRRDIWLGDFGTTESWSKYTRAITEWRAADGVVVALGERSRKRKPFGFTVAELIHRWWIGFEGTRSESHQIAMRAAARVLREFYEDKQAAAFTVQDLRTVRQAMIDGRETPDERGLTRKPWRVSTANRYARQLIAIFRFGATEGLIPSTVPAALREIQPLRGSGYRRILPAPAAAVEAAKPHMTAPVRGMVELQELTGMRPGEVCAMRLSEIDDAGATWVYTPASHKNEWRGHERAVYLGTRAQVVILRALGASVVAVEPGAVEPGDTPAPPRNHLPVPADAAAAAAAAGVDRYVFRPTDAVAEVRERRHAARMTPDGQGNEPGTNRKRAPVWTAGERYTSNSYRRAIERACDAADAAARAERAVSGDPAPVETRLVPRWNPNQLRHSYATEIRRLYGLEAAQVLLGHSSALVTEAVYAERDRGLAMRIAGEIG